MLRVVKIELCVLGFFVMFLEMFFMFFLSIVFKEVVLLRVELGECELKMFSKKFFIVFE